MRHDGIPSTCLNYPVSRVGVPATSHWMLPLSDVEALSAKGLASYIKDCTVVTFNVATIWLNFSLVETMSLSVSITGSV